MYSTYLTCPYCKDEDASEESKENANTKERVICRTCSKKFGAIYSINKDGFYCFKMSDNQ